MHKRLLAPTTYQGKVSWNKSTRCCCCCSRNPTRGENEIPLAASFHFRPVCVFSKKPASARARSSLNDNGAGDDNGTKRAANEFSRGLQRCHSNCAAAGNKFPLLHAAAKLICNFKRKSVILAKLQRLRNSCFGKNDRSQMDLRKANSF